MPDVSLHHGILFKKGGQAGNHFLHYRFGDGVDVSSLPGNKVERARLVTANHAGCSGTSALKRDGEATLTCEIPPRSHGQDDGHTGQLVEGGWRNNQYRLSSLLFMSNRRIKADEPDIAPLHYNNSLPTGFASSQTRSSSERGAFSSHCARSWSSE